MLLDGNGYRSHAGDDSMKGTYAIPAKQPRSYVFRTRVRILVDSRESNTALGIEEPERVYVYVPASVFGANSL